MTTNVDPNRPNHEGMAPISGRPTSGSRSLAPPSFSFPQPPPLGFSDFDFTVDYNKRGKAMQPAVKTTLEPPTSPPSPESLTPPSQPLQPSVVTSAPEPAQSTTPVQPVEQKPLTVIAKAPADYTKYKKLAVEGLLGLFAVGALTTFLSFILPDLSMLHQHYLFAASAVAGVALIALGALAIKKGQDSKALLYSGAFFALVGTLAIICSFHAGLDLAFKDLGINPTWGFFGIFGTSVIGLAATGYIAHKTKYVTIPGLN